MSIDADDLRALARSSPWLWSSVRLVYRESAWGRHEEPMRVWVRRPGAIRVESMSGACVLASLDSPGSTSTTFQVETDGDVSDAEPEQPVATFRADGLALTRDTWVTYDTVPYWTYRFSGVLDPRELADGVDDERVVVPGSAISSVERLEVHGREVWQGEYVPNPFMDARCGCCPLLLGSASVAAENRNAGAELTSGPDATRFLVQLDRATGICLGVDPLDGTTGLINHGVIIEEVDVDYPDELFTQGG